MKIFLVGYEKSKKILPASSFLIKKYIPNNFDIYFLNFGKPVDLHHGTYLALADVQEGGSNSWSKYLINFLSSINDEYIIFTLDDYFLSKPLNLNSYNDVFNIMIHDKDIVCAKLGYSPSDRPDSYTLINNKIFMLNSNANYSATTQYCIWNRNFLIQLLQHVNTPWEFELNGSSYLNSSGKKVIGTIDTILLYPECSAMSARHPEKISVFANNEHDIEELINLNLLKNDELICGQWPGHVLSYIEVKKNNLDPLDVCPNDEKNYYSLIKLLCT
jgi:hypothetical protein